MGLADIQAGSIWQACCVLLEGWGNGLGCGHGGALAFCYRLSTNAFIAFKPFILWIFIHLPFMVFLPDKDCCEFA